MSRPPLQARHRRVVLFIGTLLLALAAPAGAPTAALAGQYQLTSDCIDGTPGQLFVASNTDTGTLTTTETCPASGGEESGLHVGEVKGALSPYIADGAHAEYTFRTVPGTTITAISYRRYFGQSGGDADTIPALRDDTGTIVASEWCQTPLGSDTCWGGFDSVSVDPTTISDLNTSSLAFGLRCVALPPAPVCGSSGPANEAAWFTVYSASITVDETTAPSLGATSGNITAGGWMRGIRTLTLASATDPSGIQTTSAAVDGGAPIAPSTGAPSCDFGRPKPCLDLAGTSWSVDTSGLADGQHTATVAAANAAGITALAPTISFETDNTPPGAPVGLASSAGTGWQTSDTTQLTWTLPPQGEGSPITTAFAETCDIRGTTCGPPVATDSLTSTMTRAVPAGAYVEKVLLEDAAGNIDTTTASTVPFRYAAAPPLAPTAITSSAPSWQSSPTVDVTLTPAAQESDDPPLAHGEVEVCSPDGADCAAPQTVGATGGRVALAREGAFLLRGWEVNEAGLGDRTHAATTSAFYSRTPPVTTLLQTPPSRSPSRSFRLVFRSSPGGPAPVSQTTWTLCSKGRCPLSGRTTGGTIVGTAPGTGTWTLTLTPVDAAGVHGAGASATFAVLHRIPPRIHLKPSISRGRLSVRITATKGFTGAVALAVRYRIGSRTRTLHRTVRVRAASARVTLVSAGVTRATLTATFRGSERYQPARVVAHATSRPK